MINSYSQVHQKYLQSFSTIAIMEKEDSPDRSELFPFMGKALAKAKALRKQVVFLTGEIRSGKSTTHNWISNPQYLVGGGKPIDPVYEISKNCSIEHQFAEVKDCYQSVTLIPNTQDLPNSEVTLVDLPGNKDRRSEVEVMMVSYILNVFFRYASRAKFIIVISNNGFKSKDGTEFINSICSFVRLFGCRNMGPEQRREVYQSASLLVTAVPMREGYKEMKRYYLQQLEENIGKLEELRQSFEQLGDVYQYVEDLLNFILENGRMELFPQARHKEFPGQCHILEEFTKNKWEFCNIGQLYCNLEFPYREQFMALPEAKQNSLMDTIKEKLVQFEELRRLLALLIETFLEDPLTCDESTFQHIFDELSKLVKRSSLNTTQSESGSSFEELNFEELPFSLTILKGILRLYSFTFSITFDVERDEKSKAEMSYFEYLKTSFFVETVKIARSIFASKQEETNLFDDIERILGQNFEHFGYICSIEGNIEAEVHMRLKEALSVMNQLAITDRDMKKKYFEKLREDQSYLQGIEEGEKIEDLIGFIEGQNFREYELTLLNNILADCHGANGEVMKGQSIESKLVLQEYTKALQYLVKLELCYEFELSEKFIEEKDFIPKMQNVKDREESILKKIGQMVLEVEGREIERVESIYQELGLANKVEDIYKYFVQLQTKDAVTQIRRYEMLLNFYEGRQNYKAALDVCEGILKNKNLKKNPQSKEIAKRLKDKKVQLEKKKANPSQIEEKQPTKVDIIVSLINFIIQKYFPTESGLNLEFVKQSIRQHYHEQLEHKLITSEFNLNLPSKLSNYEILAYSEHLISKINKKKTVIVLGRKSGKSTACYWLRGCPLNKISLGGQGYYYALPHNANEPDRIIRSQLTHTQVPNFYTLSETQILVDAPYQYGNNISKRLLLGHILNRTIMESSECKFMMVLKESEIVSNDGVLFIELLGEYIRLFNNFEKEPGLKSGLTILINFIKGDRPKIVDALRKLENQFKKAENEEMINEKYKIVEKGMKIHCFSYLLSAIMNEGLYKFLEVNPEQQKKRNIENMPQKWKYVNVCRSQCINQKGLHHILEVDQESSKIFTINLQQKIEKLKQFGCQFQHQLTHLLEKQLNEGSNGLLAFSEQLVRILGEGEVKAVLKKVTENPNITRLLEPTYQEYKNSEESFYAKVVSLCLSLREVEKQEAAMSESFLEFPELSPYINHILNKMMDLYIFDAASMQNFEGCRLVIHEWLREISMYQTQIGLLQEQASKPKEIAVVQQFKSHIFSSQTEIKGYFCLALNFKQRTSIDVFPRNFDIEMFKQEIRSHQSGYSLLCKCFQLLEGCTSFWSHEFNKILQVFLFFGEEGESDTEAISILLKLGEFKIHLNQGAKQEMARKELEFQLTTILEKLSLRVLGLDQGLALQICDWHGNPDVKLKVYEGILGKGGSSADTVLREMMEYLMEIGYFSNKILELLSKYRKMLSEGEYDELRHRILNMEMWEGRMSRMSRVNSLEQTQLYLSLVRDRLEDYLGFL